MKYFLLILTILFCTNTFADNLEDQISKLKILPLHNGENFMKIGNRDTLIIKAEFNGETYADTNYFVLQKQNKAWVAAHFGELNNESVIGSVDDESYEDKIYGIKRIFLISKSEKSNKAYSELYILEFEKDSSDKEKRTLYKLGIDEDFDILEFQKIVSQ